jgi:predicted lipid-binding transport protein (Tim44 family)
MILKLIAMIVLGVLSAALTYYNKNYYVRVFDDILGREEEKSTAAKLGRSFVYGFLFPIYFVLLVAGLAALIAFLIVAGIIAGIAFVLVWVTEKIIPHESVGNAIGWFLSKIGITGRESPQPPSSAREPVKPADTVETPSASASPDTVTGAPKETQDEQDNPFPGGDINRTRKHTLD